MNRNGRTCEKLKNFVGKVKKIFWGLLSAWALIQGNLEVDHSVKLEDADNTIAAAMKI